MLQSWIATAQDCSPKQGEIANTRYQRARQALNHTAPTWLVESIAVLAQSKSLLVEEKPIRKAVVKNFSRRLVGVPDSPSVVYFVVLA